MSLFSGIGGFDRAFELENAQVVMQCELDRFCRSVLRRHWADVKMADDICKLTSADIPDSEVWAAGFPCQDVSLARGNHGRSGFKGKHTSLFFKLMDLIREKQPGVVLLENVVGLLNSHQGKDFALVLRELTSAGYAVSWRVLNARYFGAPQSRSRVFICAWKGDYRKALAALFEPTESAKPPSERSGFMTKTVHKTGAIVPQISYCVAATSGRHTGNDWSRSYVCYADRVRRPTPTESERLQGFPAGWTVPEDSYSTPARGNDGERYRAAGNAVAVPVVRWIAGRIMSLIGASGPARSSKNFLKDVCSIAPALAKQPVTCDLGAIMSEVADDTFVRRWKTGGCASGDAIVEATSAPSPSKPVHSEFRDVLDAEIPANHYFLTANAAAGILRRADSVGRTLFQPMRQALAALVGKESGAVPASTTGEKIVSSSLRKTGANKRGKVAGDRGERPGAY